MARQKHPNKQCQYITIMGHDLQIYYDSSLTNDTEAEFRGAEYPMAIALNPTSKYPVGQLVLHESVHAIIHLSGLSNLISPELEEALTVALEHGLAPMVSKSIESSIHTK